MAGREGKRTTLAIVLAIIAVLPGILGFIGTVLNRGEQKADKVFEVMKVQVEYMANTQKALSEDVKRLQDALLMLGMQSLIKEKEPEEALGGRRRAPAARSRLRGGSPGSVSTTGLGGGGVTPEGVSGALYAEDLVEEPEKSAPGEKSKAEIKQKLNLGDMRSQDLVEQRPAFPKAL